MTQLPKPYGEKQGRACVMQVVRVSGTIRKAEEEVVRRARDAILRARREGGDGLGGLLGGEVGKGVVGRGEEEVGEEGDGEYEDVEDEEMSAEEDEDEDEDG